MLKQRVYRSRRMARGMKTDLAAHQVVRSSNQLSARLLARKLDSTQFMEAEAAGSRMRQRNQAIDPDDARNERLKARITLPKVKGYWE